MIISRSKHRSSMEVCADCGASGQGDVPVLKLVLIVPVLVVMWFLCCLLTVDPSWASINRGLLLCAECCSVHRSMGRHISHVKSLRQGSWPPSLLAVCIIFFFRTKITLWAVIKERNIALITWRNCINRCGFNSVLSHMSFNTMSLNWTMHLALIN